MKTVAVLSMLHEPADANSATRRFRSEPILKWTLRRLLQSENIDAVRILAWQDQRAALDEIVSESDLHDLGQRRFMPQLQAITAAQKWANGWRGGLLSTCAFDRGYAGDVLNDLVESLEADAVVLIDPAAGLVDSHIIDRLITTARTGHRDYYFTQAPPGLGGVLLKRAMVSRLANGRTHPGRVVHYLPDAPVVDPVTSDACVELPLTVSRSIDRFLMDSQRQLTRLDAATEPLNGSLISTDADGLCQRMKSTDRAGIFPRELVIELTTGRHTKPIFSPAGHHKFDRSPMSAEVARAIAEEAAQHDDVRITFAGVGDPLMNPELAQILRCFSQAASVCIETDLLSVTSETLDLIARSNIDILSVHLSAMAPATYQKMMGVDRMGEAVQNIQLFIQARQRAGRSTPLVVPMFAKTSINLDEMERWYDTWLSAVGSAVIFGPSTFAGHIPDQSVADMSPPNRGSCRRIESRMTILSDGKIVMCEQDVFGRPPVGIVGVDSIESVWTGRMNELRTTHSRGTSLPVLCGNCQDWFRP